MFPAILICAFMLKNAATQTVTATLGTTKECVLKGDEVKLLCTVSSGCCDSSSRVWQKVGAGASLLSNGLSSDSSKYREDYVTGTTTGFNLIIKNVQKSDFGVEYKCQYGLTSSNELYLNDTLCPSSEVNISGSSSELNISGNCWECAGKDYGWAFLGTVIGTVNILIIAKVKIGELKTVIVGGLTFIISAVVDLIALFIGYKTCHCVDGTDPWLILLGLGTSVIIVGITIISVPTVKVHVVTTGDDVILECTVTSCLPINSVQWERNVDGSITTIKSNTSPNKYSGGTATTPSLTICNAESSDKGTYRCFASNCVGTGQSTTITIEPTVKVLRSSYDETTGDVILECTVTSSLPITSVQWERNVDGSITTIKSNTNPNKYSGSTATTPSLTILKAESSDKGTYRCFASNFVGTGQSTTITVGKQDPASGSSQGSNGSSCWPSCKVEQEPKNPKKPSSNEQPLKENKKKKPAAEKSSNEPPLEKKKKKKSAAETGSRSPTAAAKHIKTANNETEMIPTEKGFSGDLEKKRPLPPLTTQLSPTNRPLPLPSSTKPLPSSTRPLPQITTKKGDN